LEGETVEQFSLDLATQWGVGPKQQARGVLILVAPNDRKYRVEVGYGLEAILPDGKVGGFGREAIPFLRQNDLQRRPTSHYAARRGRHCRRSKRSHWMASSVAAPPSTQPDVPLFSMSSIVWVLFVVVFFISPISGFFLRLLFGGMVGPRAAAPDGECAGPDMAEADRGVVAGSAVEEEVAVDSVVLAGDRLVGAAQVEAGEIRAMGSRV